LSATPRAARRAGNTQRPAWIGSSEAIVCLESVLLPGRISPGERLARARALRAALPTAGFDVSDIDAFKREGRP